MAGEDDSGDDERTRIGGPAPMVPPRPSPPTSGTPAGVAAAGGSGGAAGEPERTRVVTDGPPRIVTPPPATPAAAAEGDFTRVVSAGPPASPAKSGAAQESNVASPQGAAQGRDAASPQNDPQVAAKAASAAPPPARSEPPAGDASGLDPTIAPGQAPREFDGDRTVVLGAVPDSSIQLRRVLAKQAFEVIQLDRANMILGRGQASDIELRTPTASRQHAQLSFDGARWTITPLGGKSMYVDGSKSTTGSTVLRGGMHLRLGDDEFLVIDRTETTEVPHPRRGGWRWLVAALRRLFGRAG